MNEEQGSNSQSLLQQSFDQFQRPSFQQKNIVMKKHRLHGITSLVVVMEWDSIARYGCHVSNKALLMKTESHEVGWSHEEQIVGKNGLIILSGPFRESSSRVSNCMTFCEFPRAAFCVSAGWCIRQPFRKLCRLAQCAIYIRIYGLGRSFPNDIDRC